jgi:hypothetical protein
MPAWSYSALTSFETCPRRHYHTRIAKDVVEPETQALTWGSAVHKALELRVTENQPLPTGMTHWEDLITKITAQGKVFTELQIALDKDLKQVDWFDKSVWVRGVVDVGVWRGTTLVALDWKTGNPKSDSDQLQLFAALLMAIYPEVDLVKTGFVWLKTNGIDTGTYHRGDLPDIWNRFLPRVTKLEDAHANQDWPERRSGLCRAWCPVKQCPQNGHYGRAA